MRKYISEQRCVKIRDVADSVKGSQVVVGSKANLLQKRLSSKTVWFYLPNKKHLNKPIP